MPEKTIKRPLGVLGLKDDLLLIGSAETLTVNWKNPSAMMGGFAVDVWTEEEDPPEWVNGEGAGVKGGVGRLSRVRFLADMHKAILRSEPLPDGAYRVYCPNAHIAGRIEHDLKGAALARRWDDVVTEKHLIRDPTHQVKDAARNTGSGIIKGEWPAVALRVPKGRKIEVLAVMEDGITVELRLRLTPDVQRR
jgi:hypothetical protein